MKAPGKTASTECLSSPKETSSFRNDVQLIKLWVKGVPQTPPSHQAVAKAVGCSPQTNNKALFLKTTPTWLSEHGQTELVPT